MTIAGSWGKHSACCSHPYLFTQLFFPLFKQKTLAQKSEMEIKLGGFLKTAVQYPTSWALSRDVGFRDFQSPPLCCVKGTSTKWIVLRAWGCGRGYYEVLVSRWEGWMCSLLRGSYLEPSNRKGTGLNCSSIAFRPLLGKLVAINTNQEESKERFFLKGLQTARLYFFKWGH